MNPYYQDEQVTLQMMDCATVLAEIPDKSVDAVITDPPYSDRTHKQSKSNKGKGHWVKAINFDSITTDSLTNLLAEMGRVSKGWVIATLDYRHAIEYDIAPPPGLKVLRVGVWVKTNPMPQISADRPGQGWEAICYMHRDDTKPKWNGGGRAGNYILPTAQNTGHPTAKPLSMLEDIVAKFTAPGDTILDPFAGSGTTLRAAKNCGRKAIGVEISEPYCRIIKERLAQEVLFA